MSVISNDVLAVLARLRARMAGEDLSGRLKAREAAPPLRLRTRQRTDRAGVTRLLDEIEAAGHATAGLREEIADPASVDRAEAYGANVENFVGTAKVPMGVIGPLRVNGTEAGGDYMVPLATSEAALVASYARGAQLVGQAGGVAAAVDSHGVLRTPAFVFDGLFEAGAFIDWVATHADDLKRAAEATTRHGKLTLIEPYIEVDTVFLVCRYETADAAGQNMVTVATQALVDHALAHCLVPPRHAFIEANFSGDKKASYLGMSRGRGRKVSASVTIPHALLRRHLRVEPEALAA